MRILRARKDGSRSFDFHGNRSLQNLPIRVEVARCQLKIHRHADKGLNISFFFPFPTFHRAHDCSNENEVEGCKKIYSCGKHALCGQKHGMPQCRWRMASIEKERKREREPFWFSVSSDSRKFAATTASRKCLSISFTQLVK